jgi:hypothetical protein
MHALIVGCSIQRGKRTQLATKRFIIVSCLARPICSRAVIIYARAHPAFHIPIRHAPFLILPYLEAGANMIFFFGGGGGGFGFFFF